MKIEIYKRTSKESEYIITRSDKSIEHTIFDSKTYFVHDICHYVVEKNLNLSKGFWGMLSLGYHFKELVGKTNPITPELRFIEQIVGPVQSIFLGYFPKEDFNQNISHLDFSISEDDLNICLNEIEKIVMRWEQLPLNQNITLDWVITSGIDE